MSGMYVLVEYMSHWLSTAKCNYFATEYEFVAIMSCLKRWKHYLVEKLCAVCTVHTSLKWLINTAIKATNQLVGFSKLVWFTD